MSRKARELNLDVFDIHFGMFDFSVRIAIGEFENAEKYAAYVFEVDLEVVQDQPAYEPRGKCFRREGYVPIIWLPAKPKTPREHATLAHEAIHAIWPLFFWVGTPLTFENEEMQCHAVAHIVNGVLERAKS